MDNLSVVNSGQLSDCCGRARGQNVRMARRGPTPNDIDQAAVAERLVRTRLGLGFKETKAFAKALDVDDSAWGKYEKGSRPIPAPYVYRIAERFSVPMEYIYRGRAEFILDQELRSRILTADISE